MQTNGSNPPEDCQGAALLGYRFALMRRRDTPRSMLVYRPVPKISVGSASCYLREDFFYDDGHLPGAPGKPVPAKDVLVVLIKKGDDLAGLFSCERDRNTQSLYARRGWVAAAASWHQVKATHFHRWRGLQQGCDRGWA